jgi:hypothetical protein
VSSEPALGYHDQPHMSRDVRRLTGLFACAAASARWPIRARNRRSASIASGRKDLSYVIVDVPDVPEALKFYERAFALRQRFVHEASSSVSSTPAASCSRSPAMRWPRERYPSNAGRCRATTSRSGWSYGLATLMS